MLAPQVAITDLPDEWRHKLVPSCRCEFDLPGKTAQPRFNGAPPGHARVQALAAWVQANIESRVASTRVTTAMRRTWPSRRSSARPQ